MGYHESTISRTINKPEIRALIEAEATKIINRGLRPAVKTICRLAAMGNVKSQDKDMLKLSLDASKHVTSMAGLSGSAPSTIINTLIQVNHAPEHREELNDLQDFLRMQWGGSKVSTSIEQVDRKYPGEAVSVPTSHTPDHVQAMNAEVIDLEQDVDKDVDNHPNG
jgi:hypothetical protein